MIFLAPGFIAIAATKTALIVGSTANIRPRILAYDVSTTGTPTGDQGVEIAIQRAKQANGTGGAAKPPPRNRGTSTGWGPDARGGRPAQTSGAAAAAS